MDNDITLDDLNYPVKQLSDRLMHVIALIEEGKTKKAIKILWQIVGS